MKKFTGCLLSLLLICSMLTIPVAAADASVTASMNYTKNVIEVTYNGNLSYDSYVTVYVAPASSAETIANIGDAVRIDQAVCKVGESVSFSLKCDASLSGDYDVFAVPSGKNSTKGSAKTTIAGILSGEARAAALAEINAKTEADIATTIFNYKTSLELPETTCPEWKNAYLAAAKAEDYSGAFKNLGEVQTAWAAADIVYAMRGASDEAALIEVIKDSGEEIGLDIDNADYKKYTNDFAKRYKNMLADENVMSVTEANDTFMLTAALTAINKRDTKGKAQALTDYEDIYGIDEDLKAKITKAGASNVARLLDGYTASTAEGLLEKLEEAADQVNGAPDNSSNNTSNNGYRGGSSGGGSSSSIKVPAGGTVVDENNYVPAGQEVTKNRFSDVEDGYWAKDYIETLAEEKIINGYEDGSFRGENTVAREEFVKMIVGTFNLSGDVALTFGDVPADFWGADVISTAVACGVINGVSDTEFGVGRPITREDMAVIIDRTLTYLEKTQEDGALDFSDSENISDYAKEAVARLCKAGLINGFEDGSFMPGTELTRAQAAKVLCEARKLLQ